MKNAKVLILLLALILPLSGCDRIKDFINQKKVEKEQEQKALDEQNKPAFQKVEDIELAKILLKPQAKKLSISRDPFTPIIRTADAGSDDSFPESIDEVLNDIKFIGVIKQGDNYRALLRVRSKQGVFRQNDKIQNYTIQEIHMDRIVLSNGEKTKSIKRGEQQ